MVSLQPCLLLLPAGGTLDLVHGLLRVEVSADPGTSPCRTAPRRWGSPLSPGLSCSSPRVSCRTLHSGEGDAVCLPCHYAESESEKKELEDTLGYRTVLIFSTCLAVLRVSLFQDWGGSAAVLPVPLERCIWVTWTAWGKGCCVVLPLRRVFAAAGLWVVSVTPEPTPPRRGNGAQLWPAALWTCHLGMGLSKALLPARAAWCSGDESHG